jgi:hypothetical protein
MSFKLSVNQLSYVFIGLVIGSIMWAKNAEKISRATTLEILYLGLGGIALVLTIYDRKVSIVKDLEQRKEQNVTRQVENQKQNFLDPINLIQENYPDSFPIYIEMFARYKSQTDFDFKKMGIVEEKKGMFEEALALHIFQIIENFLSISYLLQPNVKTEWISRMIYWFRSTTLQQLAYKFKILFSDDTIFFIREIVGKSRELVEEIVKYKDAKIGDKEANEHIRAFVRKLAKDVIVPEPDYQLKQSEEEKINVL